MQREGRSTKLRDRAVRRNSSLRRTSCRRVSVLRRQALTGPGRRSFAPSKRRPRQGGGPRLPPRPSGWHMGRRPSRTRVRRRRLRRRRPRASKGIEPRQRNSARRRSGRQKARSDVVSRTGVRANVARRAGILTLAQSRPAGAGMPPGFDFPISGRGRRSRRTGRTRWSRRVPSGLIRPSLRSRSRRPGHSRLKRLRSRPRTGRGRGC